MKNTYYIVRKTYYHNLNEYNLLSNLKIINGEEFEVAITFKKIENAQNFINDLNNQIYYFDNEIKRPTYKILDWTSVLAFNDFLVDQKKQIEKIREDGEKFWATI